MSGPPLGYRYAPVPVWVFEWYARGELAEERFVVLAFLFRFARTESLRRGRPTPSLTLEQLATAIRWRHEPESLSRLLNRMRSDGLIDYGVTGNPKTGYRYVFTLYTVDPRGDSEEAEVPSDQRPTSPNDSRPTYAGTQHGSGSGSSPEPGGVASNLEDEPESPSRPISTGERPTFDEPAAALGERDSVAARGVPRPNSLDVQDEDNFSPRQRGKEGSALSNADNAQQDPAFTAADDAQFDRWWRETATPTTRRAK